MKNIQKRGPFTFYWSNKLSTLDISLNCLGDIPLGWEWGWRDELRGREEPFIQVRIGKLLALYFDTWKTRRKRCFEVWFMGFWWIS